MPIVTHTLDQSIQPDGRISYILRMFDGDGNEELKVGLLPAGFDMQAFVAAKIIEVDELLAEREFRTLLGL